MCLTLYLFLHQEKIVRKAVSEKKMTSKMLSKEYFCLLTLFTGWRKDMISLLAHLLKLSNTDS